MHNRFASKTNLIVPTQHPHNAESELHRLRAAMITAQVDFYVRSHGNIPQLNLADHRLRVSGRVATPLNLSVQELRQRFTEQTVIAVMRCAGNCRADMQTVRPTSGDPWAPGAIGNAAWTGIALADVLHAAGAGENAGLHVAFEACDEVEMPSEGRFRYGASIPIAKAMSREVLLAYEMNGAPLAPEHGFPVRVVVPGFAGVRSPKWLAGITVQDEPSNNHMPQRDYKLVPPRRHRGHRRLGTGRHDQRHAVERRNLRSPAACKASGEIFQVRGYAIAAARDVVRVDVSMNGGRSWIEAQLEHDGSSPWSWTFWTAAVELLKGEHELVVWAWDSAGQTQPALRDDTWNFKGYLSAAWHRVLVSVS